MTWAAEVLPLPRDRLPQSGLFKIVLSLTPMNNSRLASRALGSYSRDETV
jgi:hypothetical protein